MICIGRHVGGHAFALQHGGQNYFLLISCSTFHSYAQMCIFGTNDVICQVIWHHLSLLPMISMTTKTFCFDVGQSDQRIEYSSSDSSRPHALKCLGFWRELPNTLWNVNFTTITRFPATLNADFFMKQLLVKLCM